MKIKELTFRFLSHWKRVCIYLLIIGLSLSILVSFGFTLGMHSRATTRINAIKTRIDSENAENLKTYNSKITSEPCVSAIRNYPPTQSLDSFSEYLQYDECTDKPRVIDYSSDSGWSRNQSILNHSSVYLFFNNIFVGSFSDIRAIWGWAIVLVLVVLLIKLTTLIVRQIKKAKHSMDTLTVFQRYTLIILMVFVLCFLAITLKIIF